MRVVKPLYAQIAGWLGVDKQRIDGAASGRPAGWQAFTLGLRKAGAALLAECGGSA